MRFVAVADQAIDSLLHELRAPRDIDLEIAGDEVRDLVRMLGAEVAGGELLHESAHVVTGKIVRRIAQAHRELGPDLGRLDIAHVDDQKLVRAEIVRLAQLLRTSASGVVLIHR